MGMYYVGCPVCGTHVVKSGNGTSIEIGCKKCNSLLLCQVDSNTVSCHVIKESTKKKTLKTA